MCSDFNPLSLNFCEDVFHLLAYPLVARPCHVSCAMRTRNRTPDFGVSSQLLCQCFGQRVEGHVAEFSMGSSFSQVLFQITSACLCFTSVCLACAVVRNGNYILMFGGSRRLLLDHAIINTNIDACLKFKDTAAYKEIS